MQLQLGTQKIEMNQISRHIMTSLRSFILETSLNQICATISQRIKYENDDFIGKH